MLTLSSQWDQLLTILHALLDAVLYLANLIKGWR
jgi:hypothetical protein